MQEPMEETQNVELEAETPAKTPKTLDEINAEKATKELASYIEFLENKYGMKLHIFMSQAQVTFRPRPIPSAPEIAEQTQ